MDCLARSTKELYTLTEQLKDKGVEFVSINDSFDTTTPTGKAMFGMLAVFAEFERDIIQQRTKAGRTIIDYSNYMAQFRKATNAKYFEGITTDTIYSWLNSMDVSNQTKLTRLKCLRAILGKCFNNGWGKSNFWHGINIKVDKQVKKGAKKDDVMVGYYLLLCEC